MQELHISQNFILNSLKVQMRQSSVDFPGLPRCIFSLSLSLLLAVLRSHLQHHISPLHPAKPIRDLRGLTSNQLPPKSVQRPLI